jgi:hypothetical protein
MHASLNLTLLDKLLTSRDKIKTNKNKQQNTESKRQSIDNNDEALLGPNGGQFRESLAFQSSICILQQTGLQRIQSVSFTLDRLYSAPRHICTVTGL